MINQDLKDKISQEQGIKATDAMKELKEYLTRDQDEIKTKLDALKAIVNEITTEIYKNTAPPPGTDQQKDDGAKSEENAEPEPESKPTEEPEPESKPTEEQPK